MKAFELGKEFTRGAMLQIGLWGFWVVIISAIFLLLRAHFGWDVDSTDKNGWTRSNMSLKIDYGTGVEYLSDGNGGIHVRLKPDGSIFVIQKDSAK